ncbi:MAG: PKD domain-containing protein [Saprospiraceae bacterium]|nr:PKD domain-containing protein [Candidatus Brachybacter algidus]
MKQIRIFLPVLLFCLALFIGCKKDEDIPKTNGAFTTSKTTVTVDEEITFTNTSVNATSYTWSFGDGTTSVEASPKKSWAVSGVYNVTLSATGAGGNTISNATITVTPLTAFTVENESGLSSGSPVQFTNNSKELHRMNGVLVMLLIANLPMQILHSLMLQEELILLL